MSHLHIAEPNGCNLNSSSVPSACHSVHHWNDLFRGFSFTLLSGLVSYSTWHDDDIYIYKTYNTASDNSVIINGGDDQLFRVQSKIQSVSRFCILLVLFGWLQNLWLRHYFFSCQFNNSYTQSIINSEVFDCVLAAYTSRNPVKDLQPGVMNHSVFQGEVAELVCGTRYDALVQITSFKGKIREGSARSKFGFPTSAPRKDGRQRAWCELATL